MGLKSKIKSRIFNCEQDGNRRFNKSFRAIIVWFFILLFLEIFVFNFNSYHLLFGDYEKRDYSVDDVYLTNFKVNDGVAETTKGAGRAIIELRDINIPVGTITVNLVCPEKLPEVTVKIDAADATYREYRGGIAKITVIKNDERSQTIPLHLSGNVSKLRLNIDMLASDSVKVTGISVNNPIAFRFSAIRFCLLYAVIITGYFLLYSAEMKKSYSDNQKYCDNKIIIITCLFLIVAVLMSALYRTDFGGSLAEDFTSDNGDQITSELVEAFEQGQIKLLAEPPAALAELDNPYDPSQRRESGISYLWDHVYYEGSYYSYYGIAPVVLLFLPYHLITGYYFPCLWSVLLFGMIGILFMSKFYLAIIRKWFGSLQINYIIMGLIMLQISSGIWMSICRAAFYEIAISSGFACTLAGAYYLITSNVVGEGKISKARGALAATFLSLAVLCRPTLAVYCIASLPFFYYGYKKQRSEKDCNWSKTVKYLLCSLLPFIIFGSIQMAYNYSRFGSPLDFGIKYSLTINDFTQSEFHIQFVLMITYAFLFAAPYFQPQFPFVYSSFQEFGTNGYYFVDDKHISGISIGLFFRALPMFGYFLSKKAYFLLESTKRKKTLILVLLPCVIAPLVIIFSVWESGYAVRYNADFSWLMLIGALLIIFVLLKYLGNESVHKIAGAAFVISTFLCLIVNFGQYYNFVIGRYISDDLTPTLYSLERLIEFWR